MSKEIGVNFKTRIPEFADDASIEEAFKLYHYGIDNYTVQPIPNNSIEGHFLSISDDIEILQGSVESLDERKVNFISLASEPNTIISENTTTIPLTIKAIASQSTNLQEWQNSSAITVANMSVGGYFSTSNYVSIGTLSVTSSIALNINIVNASNTGIVVKSASSQTSNLQEWQNHSSSVITSIDKDGTLRSTLPIYSGGGEVQTLSPLLLIG